MTAADCRGQWTVGWVSQLPDHLVHLVGIDGRIVPCHAVTSGTQVATDLPIHHAALELLPGGLKTRAVGHTCFGGVVQELIVLDPEGSVPGLVVCPTVVGGVGSGAGHVCPLVDVFSLQGQDRISERGSDSSPTVPGCDPATASAPGWHDGTHSRSGRTWCHHGSERERYPSGG